MIIAFTGCGAVWLACWSGGPEVGGSNPLSPTKYPTNTSFSVPDNRRRALAGAPLPRARVRPRSVRRRARLDQICPNNQMIAWISLQLRYPPAATTRTQKCQGIRARVSVANRTPLSQVGHDSSSSRLLGVRYLLHVSHHGMSTACHEPIDKPQTSVRSTLQHETPVQI